MLTTKKEPKAFGVLRGAAVLAMVIVGIVFAMLLRGEDLGTLHPWVNDVLHYVMPIAALADWLLVPAATLAYRTLWYWLIFPLAYVTYSLVRGARSHWYAYPFFNPAKHGYAGVTLYCIGICVVFLVFGIILILLTHRRKLRSNHA